MQYQIWSRTSQSYAVHKLAATIIMVSDVQITDTSCMEDTATLLSHKVPDSHTLSNDENPSEQDPDGNRCLFCHAKSPDSDANLSHMLKSHSFVVPEQHRLKVDTKTLIQYLDLIISDDSQCLYCLTQRSSSEAARQHMLGKGHCKIDITSPESEFRDFYDFNGPDESGEEAGRDHATKWRDSQAPVSPKWQELDETSVLLPSGIVLSNRATHSRRRYAPATNTSESIDNSVSASEATRNNSESVGTASANTPATRRFLALGDKLARLRASDRAGLLHLTSAQQLSQLSRQQKQTEQGRRAQRAMEARVQRQGNKTLMTNYKPDTPGRSNG